MKEHTVRKMMRVLQDMDPGRSIVRDALVIYATRSTRVYPSMPGSWGLGPYLGPGPGAQDGSKLSLSVGGVKQWRAAACCPCAAPAAAAPRGR